MIKNAAYAYWVQGIPVVPLEGKRPLVEWAKWQTQPQSREEFEALPWNQADGFAILCGTKTLEGLYVGVVDFDIKNMPSEVAAKGREVLKGLPVTQIEQTPSGGLHYVYLCVEKPKSVSSYHSLCGLEVLGSGKLCAMAPSEGYRKLNDNTPTIINGNLNIVFEEALMRASVKPFAAKAVKKTSKRHAKAKAVVRPCLSEALKKDRHLPHLMRLAVAAEYKKVGWGDEDVARLFQNQDDYSFDKSFYQVKTADPEKVASCQVIRSLGYCLGLDCKFAPEDVKDLLTEEEKARALEVLKQDSLIEAAVRYGRQRLIGEDEALIINFVALCSGQTRYPLSIIITGFSGSGKNESLRAIKPLIPREWIFEFTTSTPEAVKYIPEDFSGTLLIYEASGVQSKTGSLGLRAIGEGESIETIYPMRDEETGKMLMGRAKTNAKNFITTEADVDIFSDLYRRTFRVSMNDDPILTKRVMAKKMRDGMLPLSLKQKLGLTETFNESDFQNALRLNSWQNEVIAFTPPSLMQLLNYAQTREQQVSLRTHIEKIINFAKVLALIRQASRPKIHVEDSTYIIAAPEDFEFALDVLGDTIKQTVSRLEQRQMQVLELFEHNSMLDKNQVAEKTGFSTLTAYRVLKVLSKTGYLKEIQTTKSYSYEVLREKPDYHFNSIEKCGNRRFWLESLEKLVRSIISTFQSRGIEYSFEGVEEWIAKVKQQLQNENSITQSCKGEMVPFTLELSPFVEKGHKHHFTGELKW